MKRNKALKIRGRSLKYRHPNTDIITEVNLSNNGLLILLTLAVIIFPITIRFVF